MPMVTQIAPDDAVIPDAAHLSEAVAWAALLGPSGEECLLNLFKHGEVTATADTDAAAYAAALCDYTGYASKVLTAVNPDPYGDEDGSYIVTVPSQQFNHGSTGVANEVGGWWIEDADGNVLLAGNFPESVTMSGPTDSIVLAVSRRFGP